VSGALYLKSSFQLAIPQRFKIQFPSFTTNFVFSILFYGHMFRPFWAIFRPYRCYVSDASPVWPENGPEGPKHVAIK
jgi:hypothetical protein